MQGVKLTRLIWILQTSLEMFDKKSAVKIQSKKYVLTDKKAHGRVR